MQPRKIINTLKFRLKTAWNQAFLAHQMQNFLRQEGMQPQKHVLIYLDKHFSCKLQNFLVNRLRLKKGLKLIMLAHRNYM